MSVDVLVPPLGQTVDTLTFVSWLKNEGDAVTQGEALFMIETDKATLEVEAPATGVLRQVTARPGDEVKALSAIAVIAAPGEAAALAANRSGRSPSTTVEPAGPEAAALLTEPPAVKRAEATVDAPAEARTTNQRRMFVSPRARRLAESEGVSLEEITPTGPEGSIVERDVRNYIASREIEAAKRAAQAITPVARRLAEEAGLEWQSLSGTGPRGQITREDVERALAGRGAPLTTSASPAPIVKAAPSLPADAEVVETIPLSGIRGTIATRMAQSHSQTAPVTLTAEADATALVELRKQLAADGVAVSYNDLLLFILGKALREQPRLNASLDGDAVKLWRRVDIGLAVDTDRGLLVPVVRDVPGKGLSALAAETARLAEAARTGRCTPDELRGSTFTLTNLGMFGIDAFTPIINLPECAILGVGRIKTQPVWVNDHVEPRQMAWLSLTFDHRLVDGGPAARFLQRVVQLVEKPHLLMA
jgi:pyruvate dehydrogenase E2 component (dihydrolipoamide acetyltransferase)